MQYPIETENIVIFTGLNFEIWTIFISANYRALKIKFNSLGGNGFA